MKKVLPSLVLASCLGPACLQVREPEGRRPFILLTNDDGVDSAGLKALREELGKLGDVLVVAPAKNTSGSSQSLPLEEPVRIKKLPEDATYAVDGPPAACVLLAIENLAGGRRFDLAISGINNGENLGLDIPVSGTVGAARMAADMGIPALAFSLAYGSKEQRAAAELSAKLAREALKQGLDPGVLLNVNFPRGPPSAWKRPLLVPPGGRGFTLSYNRKEAAADGELVFEPHLSLFKGPRPEGSDSRAFAEGHVTVTPLREPAASESISWTKLRGWSFLR